ncbi:1-deoxy-D-xylulose-5-phosphate synthase [Pigmentiphaga soli]|uniref:1-deoxy-D-xylulose-5-phosphate synthase n=1 Tax=Pigmentiphaga soli TaxID=1007095 RepID=A0ABP8GW56_9BURK
MERLLPAIDHPAALRGLPRERLPQLAAELRAFVLDSVSKTGGHLSSNLGTVELTIALHYVFDTPRDRIVWDVGHQTYPHKILTGRRDGMAALRQWNGISGFPRRSESEFDTFGTAHSSTSISAALGMAVASRLKGGKRHAVAVIGDGAMTAGEAFEAMNNAGVCAGVPLLVILNDNDMSISPPVGALNRHLARLAPGARAETPVPPATMFEQFGFDYTGPIDGHDLDALIPALEKLKRLEGPQFLHVVTRKGRGYAPAEADPVLYHGPGRFDPARGIEPAPDPAARRKTYANVFGEWLCDEAEANPAVVGITPAMREGSDLIEFERRFPQRYYDVGIAEQHAVTFAGGLAAEGLRPVVAIYSTFLQRGYDQLIHDIALQNLPVLFAIDRAGVVGADGATHMGAYDLAYLRCIPNMTVMAPADENECRQMLHTGIGVAGPAAVRYPRGTGPGVPIRKTLRPLPVGRGELRRESRSAPGRRIAILAFGTMVAPSLQAAAEFDATVANMRFVKPLDTALIARLAAGHDLLVTVEEGAVMGGAGSACLEALAAMGCGVPVVQLGLPDRFIDHGDPVRQLESCGLDAAGIAASIRRAARDKLAAPVCVAAKQRSA